MSVAAEAKSVSCPTCHQRVVTEAVVVKGYVAVRRYPVANRISITKKGIVYAAVRADDLDIDGVLQGEAVVLGTLHLKKHARVTGPVRASYLRVDKGASLVGPVRIGPEAIEELDALLPADMQPAESDVGDA